MPRLHFVHPDGSAQAVEAEPGESVMTVATQQQVAGIVGECGGAMMCATCHCYVDEAWTDRAGPRHEGEDDMLEGAASEVTAASRLSCQIRLTPDLDGLVVRLPDEQF